MANYEHPGKHEKLASDTRQCIGQIALFELSEWQKIQSIILLSAKEFSMLPIAEQRELERQIQLAQAEADYIMAQ